MEFPLETLRHSAAHVMAAAVKELYPDVKFDIGPSTEEGFYYDFDIPQHISVEDFPKIEEKMAEIAKVDKGVRYYNGTPEMLQRYAKMELGPDL